MKILMIDHFLPESSYTLELGRELGKLTDLTVFCRKGAAAPMENIRWIDGFYEGGKNKIQGAAAYLSGMMQLRKEIRCGRYDIVHVQTFKRASCEIPFYLRIKKYCRFLVHTVHNLLPHEAVNSDRELYLSFYQACDLLVVHNEHCRRLLMEDYQIPAEKICVTPHGAYTLVGGENSGELKEKVNFLQFGIFRRYKGIDILLKALSLIPEAQRERFHVTVAGASFSKLDPTDYEGQAKELGLSELVTIRRGHVPEEELDQLFGEADFCLFPYRHIYGSGALLMAYSYGKPVIASDIPVFTEETENGSCGILFSSEDPEALKNAILQAAGWSGEEYRDCVGRIRELSEHKYSWRRSAGLLAEGYEALWR